LEVLRVCFADRGGMFREREVRSSTYHWASISENTAAGTKELAKLTLSGRSCGTTF
jgi:hypothetical protein